MPLDNNDKRAQCEQEWLTEPIEEEETPVEEDGELFYKDKDGNYTIKED